MIEPIAYFLMGFLLGAVIWWLIKSNSYDEEIQESYKLGKKRGYI